MAQRRVLVTGATGFIGARLVRRFAALGADVHVVFRQPVVHLLSERVTRWQCDLRDEAATAAVVRRVAPDIIVHLASEVAGARDPRRVVPMMRANLASAVHVLSAAVQLSDTRVVLAGSIEEPAPGAIPASPYAAAKRAATDYGRMFHDLWQLPVTTLRIAMVYGPGQREVAKLVPYTITSLLNGQSPELTSGHRKIDWIYVDDVVDAFVTAADSPRAAGAVLEIGSGTAVSIRDIVGRLVALTGSSARPLFGALADRQRDEARIADPSAAAEMIAWRPTVSLDDGLARTVDWFRARRGCSVSASAESSPAE